MADRTVRVALIGDASSLVGAANAARAALASLARVNIGSVTTSVNQVGTAARGASTQAQSLARTLKTGFAAMGIQAGITGIVQGFRSFITAGMEYQGNMNTLHAVTGANDTQMRMLGERAKQLGADITIPGASAADAAEAMKELAKGGLSVNQAMGAAKGTLMLAAAAQVTAAQAATIQAKALNAFRLEATEASHVADVLANGANAASGEVTDMAMGLQQSATVAHGFGISLDDTATTLALFAKNGVIGSDAGTSFKTMLQQLASPTKQQRLAMQDLGLTIYDAQGQFMGMESITAQLASAHQRLTVQQYNSAASTLFGTDAIRAANILGEEGIDGWNKMADAVLKAGGAQELAAAQTIGLNGAVNAFTNVVSTASQEVFDKLQPAMVGIVNAMTGVASAIGGAIGWFQMLPGPIQGVVVGLGMMILLRGPLKALWVGMKEGAWATMSLKVSMIEAGMGANFMQVGLMRASMAMKGLMATFIANPFGWILLAASTILPMFIDVTEDATAAVTDYSDAIDINTGKLKENASASIAESGKQDAEAYRNIGGALGEWTVALMGNADAQNAVHTAIQAAAEQQALSSGAYAEYTRTVEHSKTTLGEFATGVLNGTIISNKANEGMTTSIDVNRRYSSAVSTLGSEITTATGKTEEQAAADNLLAAAGTTVTASHSDMEKAIQGVNDSMGEGVSPMIAFKSRIDATKHSLDFADLSAQSLTISLLNMMGSNLTAEQAERANNAAMRMVATSARQHAQALDEITKKQEDLNDLQAGNPDEVEKAQKAADKAAKAAQDAQEEQGKSAEQAAKQIADAQKALDKSRKQADKSIQEAQDRLNKVQGDPGSSPDDLKAAQDALKDAQEGAADSVEAAQQRITDAQASAADSAESAQGRVADAADSAAEAQQGVSDAQDKAVPSSLELSAASRAIEDAQDAAAAAADAQADAIDKAGQSARDMTAAAYSNKAAQGDLAGGIVDATAVMEEQRKKFIDSAVAAGYSGEEAETMANKQGLISPNVETTYISIGLDSAILKAQALNEALSTVDGKTVHFTAHGNYTIQDSTGPIDQSLINVIPGLGMANILMQNQAKALAAAAKAGIDPNHYGDAAADLHADGGFITGPGGPRDDMISAPWLSNGEFVVNAASTAKWRWFLELINGKGFADGGVVSVSGAAASAGQAATTAATAGPSADTGVAAWAAISDAAVAAWNVQMLPVFDALTARNAQLGLEFQALSTDWTTPAWTQIGTTVWDAWNTVILPTYTQLNLGSHSVGDTWAWLDKGSAAPAFADIRSIISDSWNGVIQPTYSQMNAGTTNVGYTFGVLQGTTGVTWSAIGATIAAVYNGQIVPAWTGVQGFVTTMGEFFTGAQTGMTTAATQVTTDLATITTKIDEFFKMVDTKAPVVATTAATPTATTTVGSNILMADGGPITVGTTGRADDVLIRASKGEYVVNAKSAAAHRPELDSINYGGAYADGGMIGEKIGNRIGNYVLDGAQRAIGTGVDRLLATVPATSISGTSTATGFTSSQDPSSFGWVRAANQVPYSWQGRSFGSTANGTQGLWNALLDFIAPLIPGGINSNVGIFEDRVIAGTSTPSFHSYGLAMDINSDANGRGLPGYGRTGLYEIPGEPAHAIADKLGMEWGGDWSYTDPMHFEIHVPPSGISGISTAVAAPVPAAADAPAPTWVQTILDKIAKGGTQSISSNGLLVSSDPGMWGSTRLQDTTTPTTLFSPMSMSRGTAENVGPVPPGDAVERWRPLYAHAMQMLGKYSEQGLEKMMYQMFRESSGNPLSYAIDGNYYAGKPSKGLLQTIPSTFVGNAPPGYNTNIWDPLSNALASLNYIGDPMKYPGGAYANGGIVGSDSVPAMLTPGEAVISPFSAYRDKQKNLVNHAASWFGGSVSYPDARSMTPVINVAAPVVQVYIGNENITGHVEIVVDGKLAQAATAINRKRGQAL